MKMRRSKKNNLFMLLFLLVLGLGIGYALISSNLTINGIGRFHNQSWDVHFEDLTLNPGNVELSQDDVAATIDQTTMTDITFTVTLNEPGDFYEFEVAAVNAGTMDAMIGVVTNSLNGNPISETNPVPSFASYTATYSDGVEIAPNHLLEAGYSETYKVRVEYRTDIDPEDLPTEPEELTFTFGVQYVQKDANTVIDVPHPPTLYGVMESYAQEGTYAKKYTGAHQDSFAGTGNKEIYHWYANSGTPGNTLATEILDKNNVIFAGHCWQMMRTTDTGGVKMIYNGEVENNQCLNTRGNHIGYTDSTTQSLNSSYYYGTDYTYDSTNNVFILSGTLEQATWDATTGPTLIGKYTCKNTDESGTCATLYLIESYYDTTKANVILLNSNSHYSQFGKIMYSVGSESPAYVGYMYNDYYSVKSTYYTFYITDNTWTIKSNYYYSDSIDWNTTSSNLYSLLNPIQISTLSDYSTLVGKYVMVSGGINNTQAYYIAAVSDTTAYCKSLKHGDLNTSITIGDSYTESGGVYTLTGNVTNVPYNTWYNTSDLSIYKGKYVCDGNNTSCSNIKHIYPSSNPGKNYYYYFDTGNTWSFAEDVVYNNGVYTLSGDVKTFWDFYDPTNQTILTTHHYTCLENGNSCSTVGYITYLSYLIYYVPLSNVANIETAINNMLYASNVNTKNSIIKTGIDAWYAKYLAPYDSYIEDTIFCNDRTIKSLGGWNPNGGSITNTSDNYLKFQEYTLSNDLSCDRVTDQFSTQNSLAHLTYKVGLMSSPEMKLLNNGIILNTGQEYRLITPYYFGDSGQKSFVYNLNSSGGFGYNYFVRSSLGLRPAISIKPGTFYVSGDGSMANPFVIE